MIIPIFLYNTEYVSQDKTGIVSEEWKQDTPPTQWFTWYQEKMDRDLERLDD